MKYQTNRWWGLGRQKLRKNLKGLSVSSVFGGALCVGVLLASTGHYLNAKSSQQILPKSNLDLMLDQKVSDKVAAFLNDPNLATIPVLVKMKEQVDLSSFYQSSLAKADRGREVYRLLSENAQRSQASLVGLLKSRGNYVYRQFYVYSVIAIWNADKKLVQELATRSDVEKVFGNPTVQMEKPLTIPMDRKTLRNALQSPIGDNILFTKADQVWSKYPKAGEGIVIGGQDTGVEWNHPALIRQYRGSSADGKVSHEFNWHDSIHKATPIASNRCGYDLTIPCDDGDHGTHTMGTMVGAEGDGFGNKNVVGMSPKSKWIACRNMDGGAGTPASYIECFEWFLAPYASGANAFTDGKPELAPHVINNSWGCPTSEGCTGAEILPALEAMRAAGIMTVVSAGNEGPGCQTIEAPPAYHTGMSLRVGAYNHRSGSIAGFSSRGPSLFDGGVGPDVVAPGVNIRSTVPGKKYAQANWSGTSMAGPHVAGAVALLWSVKPELVGNFEETLKLFTSTAEAKTSSQSCGGVAGSAVPNNTYGYGVFDLGKMIL